MSKNPEAKITVKMFNDDFKKGAKELTKESQTISREFKLQSEQMKLTATETEKLQAKMDFLSKKHDVAKRSVQEHEQAYEQAKSMFGENSKAAEDMAKKLDNARIDEQKLANEIELTNRKLKDQQTEAGNTASKIDEMGEKISNVGSKMKDVGDGMTDAGARMSAGITAPIVGIGVAAKSAWEEIDNGLDTIVSKTGATGEVLESLEKSFDNVYRNNKFDAQQVGDAVGEVNTQFALMGEELDNASVKMLRFADINGADVAGSSIKSKQAMSMFNLEAEDLDMVLDSVTKTAQNTGQSTDKLFEVVTKGAPQLQAMGLDFAQSVEVMGNFEKAGIDSSTAMSYLSRAQVEFAKDGKKMQEGLEETIAKMKGAKDETEALELAAETFGTKGATRMYDAIKNGAFEFDEFANAATNAQGAVDQTFEGMEDPIDSVSIGMNNLKAAGADLFGMLQELLLPVGLRLIEMLQGAVEWFMGLSDNMKTTIIVVAAIAAAIGPLVLWIGTLVSTVGSAILVVGKVVSLFAKLGPIITGLKAAFAVLTGPVGLVIAIIAALIAIGVALYRNWDTISTKAVEIFTGLQVLITTAMDSVKTKIDNVMRTVETIFTTAMEYLSNLIGVNFGSIQDNVSLVMEGIRNIIDTVWSYIKETFNNALEFLKALFTGDFERMKEIASEQLALIKETIGFLLDDVKMIFTNAFNIIKTFVSTVFGNIKTAITSKITESKNTALTVIEALKTGFYDKVGSILTKAKDTFDKIKKAITDPIDTAKETVLGIIDTIKEAFSKMKITIPKPKLPKVSVEMKTKKILGKDIPWPDFSIEWFKTGGVFTKPVVAGNAGFGDVAEAIVPFEGSHAARIARLIAEQQNKLANGASGLIAPKQDIVIEASDVIMDGRAVGKVVWKPVKERIDYAEKENDLMR
ncbi:phage tail tape measure protein [Sporosarcina saromensis]|uniref:Phage tail tape measure protein n=1 Tax=Sporosarcina saromensis TaxID=359365 RepID=A0ABU4G5F2_9BACL|nr:phage tail tape measure protein [Sporosarcina saromensis]MDW0112204.1 phage tail tape measure protein [Sporosarcina saromensis]